MWSWGEEGGLSFLNRKVKATICTSQNWVSGANETSPVKCVAGSIDGKCLILQSLI